MASIDLEAKIEERSSLELVPGPWLAWDSSLEATPLGFGWDAEPLVVDWSGPGSADLLVTAGGGPSGRTARLYRAVPAVVGAPRRYDGGTIIEGLEGLRCLCPLPNPSPTRFDLAALDRDGLVFLSNEGGAGRPLFRSRQGLEIAADLGIGPCRVVQIVAIDWDGDGLVDLLAGIDDLTGYWPKVDRVPPEQQVGFNQHGGHPCYDRNGLWRGQPPRGRIFWLRNVGRPGDPAFVLQPEIVGESGRLELAPHPAPLALSWGGGRSFEVLITDSRNVVHIHRNFGGQRPPVLMEPRTLRCGHSELLLPEDRTTVISADLDGDSRDELVFGTSDGRVYAVHAARARNEATTPTPLLQEPSSLWLGGRSVLAAGDLDNDGDLDLVVGNATGRLSYVQDLGRAGAHRYAAPVPIEAGGAPFRIDPGPDGMIDGPLGPRLGHACPTLADWSGHGRLDLIVGGAGGEVVILRNDGAVDDPRFGAPVALRCQGSPLILPPRVRPAVADWDGSGGPDLIAIDLQGFLTVFPRTGTYEVGPPVPLFDHLGRLIRLDGGFRQSGGVSLWAGPWTGSGKTDLLIGLPRGNRHVIPPLTGLPLVDVDDLPTVLVLENHGNGTIITRPMRHRDGRPIVVGTGGCSPSGVPCTTPGEGALDLLICSDDGYPTLIPRDELLW